MPGCSLYRAGWLPTPMHPRWAQRRREGRCLVLAAERCLYQTLGLPRNATKAEVKAAYRRLARQHHPDARPSGGGSSGSEAFQAISQAFEVLSDDVRRLAYDHFGLAGLRDGDGAAWGPGAAATRAGAGQAPGFCCHWTSCRERFAANST